MFSPELYDKNQTHVDDFNKAFTGKLADLISWNFTSGNVLDYGCGPGFTGYSFILPKVEATNSQMYSVDISPKMVEFASKKYAHQRMHYATGHYPDKFPFDSSLQFDKIFSINVFHFINDIQSTFDCLVRALKPAGQIAFTSTNINFPPIKVLDRISTSLKWKEYLANIKNFLPKWSEFGNVTPQDFYYDQFINKTGLKVVYFKYDIIELRKPMEALLDLVMSMNPCLSNVPVNLHSDLREDCRGIYADILKIPLDSNEVSFPTQYVIGILEKP